MAGSWGREDPRLAGALPSYVFLCGYKAMRRFKDVQRRFRAGQLDRMRDFGAEIGMTPRHIDERLRVISSMILHTRRDPAGRQPAGRRCPRR
ncbi:hypothetical protein [Streptomyces sp. NPDC058371]|uniref:hypothetical protein n=1 Tax=Streptomyces sp. NPDC058371 TaxID=3346463 RepID=UPI0036492104